MQTDDLASLANLDETVLLEELRVRYDEDKIYTYVGDILVAVNPFRAVPLYTPEARAFCSLGVCCDPTVSLAPCCFR